MMNSVISPKATILLLAPLCGLLLVFFAWPLGIVIWTSIYSGSFTPAGYLEVAGSALIHRVLLTTFQIAFLATAVSLLFGYVIALHLVSLPSKQRTPYLVMVMLPFWTSILVKSYAFTVVLGDAGTINKLLTWVSGGAWHVTMMFNRAGVVLGMTNYLLPFMVLPIMASLLSQNSSLKSAAEIMGAGPIRIFCTITLPLSMPGILAGVLMCLTLSMGMYITPALLGGRRDMMMANLIDFYTRQTLDWTLASAIAVVLLALSGVLITGLIRLRRSEGFSS